MTVIKHQLLNGRSQRLAYSPPSLSRFGSVRNLTGGSSGMASDGGNTLNPTKMSGASGT